ncbi:hypothetical protein DRO97_05185 [Archaeoglobales archaeon]|nr:MAG: hypothetical protein DRO97_05185 [Archaeoglobales archaeon]
MKGEYIYIYEVKTENEHPFYKGNNRNKAGKRTITSITKSANNYHELLHHIDGIDPAFLREFGC